MDDFQEPESAKPETTQDLAQENQQASQQPEEKLKLEKDKNIPESEEGLMKEFPKEKKSSPIKTIVVVFFIIIVGVASGYMLSSRQGTGEPLKSSESTSSEQVKVGDVFGVPDEKTFRDQAEGVLVKGGVDGEGSHHLMRPGGVSQNVYLTSSIMDLDLFIDHKVKLWGETFSAQKAGWLMDVGRVEISELNAEKPFEE